MEKEVAERPHLRLAQKLLAKQVTTMVHGAKQCKQVIDASQALWGTGDLHDIDAKTLLSAVTQLPTGKSKIGDNLVDMLIATGLEKGRSAARRTIESGGVYLNNEKIVDEDYALNDKDILAGDIVLIRKGKRNLAVVKLEK